MKLNAKRCGNHALPLPKYGTEGATGLDLSAAIAEPVWLWPFQRKAIPCGFAFQGQQVKNAEMGLEVRPRSGISRKRGLVAIQGTIDPDYTGEVQVVLVNLSLLPRRIMPGERIAQAVPEYRYPVEVVPAMRLEPTARGDNGFGSTGTGV